MKILVMSHVSDYVGGAERSILDVIDEWKKETPNIELFFVLRQPLGSYVTKMKERGYSYEAVDFTYWSDSNLPNTKERKYTHTLRNTRAIKKIESIIDDFRPDFVLTNSIVAPWAAFAAHFKNVPHVWFAREYGDLDHGRDFEMGRANTWKDIGSLSSVVLTNSRSLSDHAGQFIDKKKIVTVYNPFDLKKIIKLSKENTSTPFKSKESLKLVLTSGGIAPSKGQRESIEAVGLLNSRGYNVELCLVGRPGTSAFMGELDALISKHGIEGKVHLTGYTHNPLSIAAHADLGLMASRMEAFGRVTFEYQAIGLPVVGANSGATPEIVQDGISGYLYQPGESIDLAEKIENYLLSKDLIAQHSTSASRRAETMMKQYTAKEALGHIASAVKSFVPANHITYAHHFLDYPEIAKDYYTSVSEQSLRSIVVTRLKNRLRPHYKNARSLYAKITGK